MKNKIKIEEKTEKQFRCSDCKKLFNINERGYFSYSQGNVCIKCWDKLSKIRRKNEDEVEKIREKEFENKILKIIKKYEKNKKIIK